MSASSNPKRGRRSSFYSAQAKSQMYSVVEEIHADLNLDLASRARRGRALVRLTCVVGWLVLAVTSGSPRWAWGFPWVLTIALSVAHAYRTPVLAKETRFGRLRPLVEKLIPPYSAKPGLNVPGVFDAVGNVIGGLAAGNLSKSLDFMHIFDYSLTEQASAGSASLVLAGITLIGGTTVATQHFNWHDTSDDEATPWYFNWYLFVYGLSALIFALLWPGSPASAGFRTRLLLDIAVALASVVVCFYGRADIRKSLRTSEFHLGEVKLRVRRIDAESIHNRVNDLRTVVANLAPDAARSQLVTLIDGLDQDRLAMRDGVDGRPENGHEVLRRHVAANLADAGWTVGDDVNALAMKPQDAGFMVNILEQLLSNARKNQAKRVHFDIRGFTDQRCKGFISVCFVCDCGKSFTKDKLDRNSSLGEIDWRMTNYDGEFTITEPNKEGEHVFTLTWQTTQVPPSL